MHGELLVLTYAHYDLSVGVRRWAHLAARRDQANVARGGVVDACALKVRIALADEGSVARSLSQRGGGGSVGASHSAGNRYST
jgi:hypothetical protein